MRKKIVWMAASGLLTFSVAFPANASLDKFHDLEVYTKAFELCHTYMHAPLTQKAIASVKVSTQTGFNGVKAALNPKDLSLSPQTKQFIESSGYYQALNECFGSFSENRVKWDSFTLMLILSDASAQALTYYGAFKLSSSVFQGLRYLSGLSKAGNVLLIEKYLSLSPKLLKIISWSASGLIAASGGKMAYDGYRTYQELFDEKHQRKKWIK